MSENPIASFWWLCLVAIWVLSNGYTCRDCYFGEIRYHDKRLPRNNVCPTNFPLTTGDPF
jgi:hypothetical protein